MEQPFPPTKRRIERALAEGNVPLSRFAVRTAPFMGALILAPGALRALATRFRELLVAASRQQATRLDALVDVQTLALPLLGALAGIAATVTLLQTGARGGGGRPRPAELPLVKLIRSTLLTVLLAVAIAVFLRGSGRDLRDAMDPKTTVVVAAVLVERAFWLLAAALVVVVTVDVVLTRAAWLHGLRMSRRERLEEQRAEEAPLLARRARRRAFDEIVGAARSDAIPR